MHEFSFTSAKLLNMFVEQCTTLNVSKTEIAHDKAINSVCISPNDSLVATASQDKTAKVGIYFTCCTKFCHR